MCLCDKIYLARYLAHRQTPWRVSKDKILASEYQRFWHDNDVTEQFFMMLRSLEGKGVLISQALEILKELPGMTFVRACMWDMSPGFPEPFDLAMSGELIRRMHVLWWRTNFFDLLFAIEGIYKPGDTVQLPGSYAIVTAFP